MDRERQLQVEVMLLRCALHAFQERLDAACSQQNRHSRDLEKLRLLLTRTAAVSAVLAFSVFAALLFPRSAFAAESSVVKQVPAEVQAQARQERWCKPGQVPVQIGHRRQASVPVFACVARSKRFRPVEAPNKKAGQ